MVRPLRGSMRAGWPFAHGVVLALVGVLWLQARYEDGLYDQLVQGVAPPGASEEQRALALVAAVPRLLRPRLLVFGGRQPVGVRDRWFRSADIQLLDARGACGSFAHVLARALQRAGHEVRLVQMLCASGEMCHVVVEARIGGRFAVLDPFYGLVFRRPDGRLASFAEVAADWPWYRRQVPDDYDPRYAYAASRYTNWEKLPVVMPLLRRLLVYALGTERVRVLSLRTWFLNLYRVWAWGSLALELVLLGLWWLHRRRRGRLAAPTLRVLDHDPRQAPGRVEVGSESAPSADELEGGAV